MATQLRTPDSEGREKIPKPTCRAKPSGDASLEMFQPFPTSGPLFDNLNKTQQELRATIGGASGGASGKVRSYKMTSVQLRDGQFGQEGCGPNFQGGRLTLCTCMHRVRAERCAEEWHRWWIAGLTNQKRRVWLFYLAEVANAYESQQDIWEAVPPEVQKAKCTRNNSHGDLYEPQFLRGADSFDSANYHLPMVGHRHRVNENDETWQRDIDYFDETFKRHSAYLSANPRRTFLWESPMLYVDDHSRTDSWTSINHLLSVLKSI